jgi:uncharacterized membrane protein
MVVSSERINQPRLHPLHGILLAATIPLFGGVLLSDLAYASSYQIQWSNFASWLIVGGLIFSGLVMVWAIAHLLFARHRDRCSGLYLFLLVSTWVLGFFNSLIHARDAWAMMPTGLILSVIVFLLACASNWIGFVKFGVGGQR